MSVTMRARSAVLAAAAAASFARRHRHRRRRHFRPRAWSGALGLGRCLRSRGRRAGDDPVGPASHGHVAGSSRRQGAV